MKPARTAIAPTIPVRIDTLGRVPHKLHALYDATGEDFVLNAAGRQLERYRRLKKADPNFEPSPPFSPTRLDRKSWSLLLGVAEPHERPTLMRWAAAGQLKIGG